MMKLKISILAVASATILSGCFDRAGYETIPVKLETPEGVVTCQLYTPKRVMWDRAIAAPDGMTTEEANAYCVEEGQRQVDANKASKG